MQEDGHEISKDKDCQDFLAGDKRTGKGADADSRASSHRVRPHSGGILREETRVGKRSRTDA